MELMASSKTLKVLLLKEGDRWIAQCLEFDIATQGTTISDSLDNFCEVFAGQIAFDLAHNREPLSDKKPAPPWYWQVSNHAEKLERRVLLKVPKEVRPKLGFRLASTEAWVG